MGHFVLLFPFHSSILKPDFDLTFGETQGMGDFDPSSPRQIPVEMKFFLQFQRLISSIGRSLTFGIRTVSSLAEMNPFHPGIDLWRIS